MPAPRRRQPRSSSPSPGLMIWTLVVVPHRVLSAQAPRVRADRRGCSTSAAAIVRENLEAAERSRDEAQRLLEEYQQQLAEARHEASRDRRARPAHRRGAARADARGGSRRERERGIAAAKAAIAGRDAPGARPIKNEVADLTLLATEKVVLRARSTRPSSAASSTRRWPTSTSRRSARRATDGPWRATPPPPSTPSALFEAAQEAGRLDAVAARPRRLVRRAGREPPELAQRRSFNPAFPAPRQEGRSSRAAAPAPTSSSPTRCSCSSTTAASTRSPTLVEDVRRALPARAAASSRSSSRRPIADRRRRGRRPARPARGGDRPDGHHSTRRVDAAILGGVVAAHARPARRRLRARPARRAAPARYATPASRALPSGGEALKLQPNEIASILREQIEKYEVPTGVDEVGTVIQLVGDGIARVYGLENCVAMEMLEFPHGVTGLALNLEEDNVAVRALRRVAEDRRGRHRPPHRQRHAGPGRRGPRRPRRRPARQPARRRAADRDRRDAARSSSRRPASSTASR